MAIRHKRASALVALMLMALALSGCASNAEVEAPLPSPTGAKASGGGVDWSKEKHNIGEDGEPTLKVYVKDSGSVETMALETYVQGVLAGEMKNDWHIETLKAQAILARTFVLKFVAEKQSKYEGAQISTDIEEAQAYDASAVNERIKQAVSETSGLVLSSDGELPYAWFHAHSGGATALAKEGLGWEKNEPSYTQVVKGMEPEDGSAELKAAANWEARFTAAELEAACAAAGKSVDLSGGAKLEITERGESGRAITISVGGVPVNAASLRIALGSTKMRSTLLTGLRYEDGGVYMAGKGYGHGVGMSQWGAYGMAKAGNSAEDIITHYFRGVTIQSIK